MQQVICGEKQISGIILYPEDILISDVVSLIAKFVSEREIFLQLCKIHPINRRR